MVFNCVNLLVGHFQSEKRKGGQAFLQDLSLTGVQDVSGLSPDFAFPGSFLSPFIFLKC